MKLFKQEEILRIQQLTMSELGLSKQEFIDLVGSDIASEIKTDFSPETPIVIFAGPHNCGAYSLSAAFHLHQQGFNPYVFLFNIGGSRLNDECDFCRRRFSNLTEGHSIHEITGLRFTMPELDPTMVIIDGLFDANIDAPLSRGYQILVTNINESGASVISIDSPSGLPGNPMSGLINSKIIHATLTLTVTLPKLAFFISDNVELVGKWKAIGPKPSASVLAAFPHNHFLIEADNIAKRLHHRCLNSSKADYGSAILFAGSYGMMGAAVLSTMAAARSGCGKVTCHSPKCGFNILQSTVPSALFEADPNTNFIQQIELNHSYSAVALGPGMGTHDTTIDALESFFKVSAGNSRPLILDADALNCIAIRPSLLDHLPILSILTPHSAEFDRIFGQQPSSSARLAKAIEVSRAYKIIIVLKGFYTATVRPDGKVFYNSSGTPSLATAGSGDVLTGLMAGLVAQGMKPEIASIVAVYIHGVAGKISEDEHGVYGVVASDIAQNIGKAFKAVIRHNC